jgi:hypothetical protein
VVRNGSWKKEPNGCLTTKVGDVAMMVEKVGATFRIVVTRGGHESQPGKVLASASAADALAAMALAERVASQGAV